MAVVAPSRLITAEEFRQMEFGSEVELVRGEILEMTRPGVRHGLICVRFARRLDEWCDSNTGFITIGNDTGVITLRNPDSVRGPDVMVIRKDRLPNGQIPEGWLTVSPDLVVEVMSPSDRWDDLLDKTAEYLSAGVREVWVVDPAERSVHCFQAESSPRKVTAADTLDSMNILPGFSVPAAMLFDE